MKIFGFQIGRKKALSPPGPGKWYQIWDTHPGAWQQESLPVTQESLLTFSAVFACIRLISSDIGKLGLRLVELKSNGIWREITNSAHSPVLRKPNANQTRIKFFEQWVTSKLIHGNTYVLKGRDNRGVVTSMKVLDPSRVETLVSDSAEVFYRLKIDNFAGVKTEITVPSTEIIRIRGPQDAGQLGEVLREYEQAGRNAHCSRSYIG
jgi:HK97 family phage portal protein